MPRWRARAVERLGSADGPAAQFVTSLVTVGSQTIRELIQAMVTRGNRARPGKAVARSTVKEGLKAVAAILNTAVEDGLIPANPCSRMTRQIGDTGAEVQEIEIFAREELARLLSVAETDYPEWYAFVLTLARAGLRLGEAIGLEWADVDHAAQVLHIRRSCRRGTVSVPKNGKARIVDMSPLLGATLKSRQSLVEAEAALAGQAVPVRIFPGRTSRHGIEDYFRSRVWEPILRRAEIRYRKIHTLRHTFASLLITNGESLPYIQAQLGHHSPAFTLAVYGHLMPRRAHRGVDALDAPVGAPVAGAGANP